MAVPELLPDRSEAQSNPHLHKGFDRLKALDLLVLGHALGVEGGQLTADARVLLEQRPSERLGYKKNGGGGKWVQEQK